MPTGKLNVHLTDLRGLPTKAKVTLDFQRLQGDAGVGGASMDVTITMGTETDAIISGLPCRGGPGTMYRVAASAPHYRDYSFFQLIVENTVSTASDDVEFWIKPGDVKDIAAPAFAALPSTVQALLTNAALTALKPEDRDVLGLSGKALYDRLGPLRKACLLNIATKAAHETAATCLPDIERLLVCRQDRIFAVVAAGLEARINESVRFTSADNSLHDPLPGFTRRPSFKSRDAHANLQLTFMQHEKTGQVVADIDIDESTGINHGREVIENALFRKRTSPYLIREFLLAADPITHALDPGYTFVF
jgi:hypothetical protein